MDLLKHIIVPVNKEGYPFIFIAAVASLVLGAIYSPLGWLGAIIVCWMIYFFRDPDRVTPIRPGLIIAPADGVISKIERALLPPEIAIDGKYRKRISIFLNIFNVHVNRVPVAGKISGLNYYPGKFFNASLDKASAENERQSVRVTNDEGEDIVFVQIAGLIARRIVCNLKNGQEVKAGERFGIIRFGSRMDVYVPEEINPLVIEGQQVIAGETVLADFGSGEGPRTGVKH